MKPVSPGSMEEPSASMAMATYASATPIPRRTCAKPWPESKKSPRVGKRCWGRRAERRIGLDPWEHSERTVGRTPGVRTLRAHRKIILNQFQARKEFSSGVIEVIEGLNNRTKVQYEGTRALSFTCNLQAFWSTPNY